MSNCLPGVKGRRGDQTTSSGLKTTIRVRKDRRCPICGRARWCLLARDGSYAICMREESSRPARGNVGGWVHRLADGGGASRSSAPAAARTGTSSTIAPLERRDRVYRRVLSLCRLGGQHRQDLLARGYSEKEIAECGYGSLPLQGRARLCREIMAADPLALDGVPGFYRRDGKGGDYWTLAGSPGLLIPCRAPDGRIRGVRIRPDDPGEGGKYRWLSSKDRPGGCGSGVHCHVARPPVVRDDRLWVVEGEIKADLSAARLAAVVVSIPGVDSWARVLFDVRDLLPPHGRVVVALDADWRVKLPVHQAAWNLTLALQALNFVTEFAQWNEKHKGLDDLMTAGLWPEVHHPQTVLPAPVWSQKMASRLLADVPPRPSPRPSLPEARRRLTAAFPRVTAVPAPCA
jgi:hypothetical protein